MQKYSFLMSVYYKEKPKYLEQSIDSMLNQTQLPDEIVIVKDGPIGDDLNSVIDNYVEKFPELFKIIESEKNIGLGLALNLGLKNCKNELVARMDSDDICVESRCEKELLCFEKNKNLSVVGSWVNEFEGNINNIVSKRIVPSNYDEIYNYNKKRSAFNHPTVMYKKSSVLECGGYYNLRRNQDVDLFGRMLFNGKIATNIEEPLLFFRINNDLSKRRKSWENTKTYIKVIKNFYKLGYSSLLDLIVIAIGQVIMFSSPIVIQNFIYKKILRK